MRLWRFFGPEGQLCGKCAWVLRYQGQPVIPVMSTEERAPGRCSHCRQKAYDFIEHDRIVIKRRTEI